MSGRWSGGAANRAWGRPGRRGPPPAGDAARGARLFALLAGQRFWCETCNGSHLLRDMQACRDAHKDRKARNAGKDA